MQISCLNEGEIELDRELHPDFAVLVPGLLLSSNLLSRGFKEFVDFSDPSDSEIFCKLNNICKQIRTDSNRIDIISN